MKKAVNIKVCVICLLLLSAVVYFLYSLKHPVTAKIYEISVSTFSDSDEHDVEYVKSYLDNEQIFYDSDAVLSNNTNDYVLVTYDCKVKSNCLSPVNLIYCMVNNVPENDNAFISAHRLDFPRQAFIYMPIGTASFVLMNRRGLTDEELYEKIKSVKLDVIYKHKGKSGTTEVKGIDSIDSDDIEWITD